jgi:hypothetical protein
MKRVTSPWNRVWPPVLAGIAFLLAACTAAASTGLPSSFVRLDPGDRILCLFDSSEGVSRSTAPLAHVVAPAIERLGFRVEWRDIAKGVPKAGDLDGFRAVVSGFLDGRMAFPRQYVEFVRAVTEQGVRFVVVGNFGAWQDAANDSYLSPSEVNRAFGALGVRYEAWWTDDPARFRVEVMDPALGPADSILAKDTRLFYQFTPARPDVRVLVKGRRTDEKLPDSALAFTSANGAMVLSTIMFPSERMEPGSPTRLDLDAFLGSALARMPQDPATLLVVWEPGSSDSRRAMQTLSTAALYTGVPMVAVEVGRLDTLRPMDLHGHRGVILAAPEIPSPRNGFLAGLLRDLLVRGGSFLSLLPVRDPVIISVLGGDVDGVPDPAKGSGLLLEGAAFPGVGGMEARLKDDGFTGYRISLPPGCTVLARVTDGKGVTQFPAWWRCPVGRGEVSVLNAWEFVERATAGLVVQAVLDVAAPWTMPVLSAAVEFVDDCPLPMTGAVHPSLGKVDVEYYLNDYYGTVRDTARRHGFRPTFLAIFSYDEEVAEPWPEPFPGMAGSASLELAERIRADDFPIGLHGMNHVSPAVAGGVTKSFKSEESLRALFSAARVSFREVFGPAEVPVVYVPPNDYIDAAGKRALVAAIPEVRVLASVFSGSEVETSQEFGRDPVHPSLVGLPRTWAGSALEGESLIGMWNGLLLMAVSTHFVHPDDALDPERAQGRSWSELGEAYARSAAEIRRRFPFLRELTALEAAAEVDRLGATGLGRTTAGDGTIRLTRAAGMTGSLILLHRMPKGCRLKVEGGEVVQADAVSNRAFIRMEQRALTMRCEGAAEVQVLGATGR